MKYDDILGIKKMYMQQIEDAEEGSLFEYENVVAFRMGDLEYCGIEEPVDVVVYFESFSFTVAITNIGIPEDKEEIYEILNEKNNENLHGKYFITENGEIWLQSVKWIADIRDIDVINDVLEYLLEDYGEDYEELKELTTPCTDDSNERCIRHFEKREKKQLKEMKTLLRDGYANKSLEELTALHWALDEFPEHLLADKRKEIENLIEALEEESEEDEDDFIVESEEEQEDDAVAAVSENISGEITIYGQKYQITEGLKNYAKVKKEFEDLSEQYVKLYEKDLEMKCINAGALVNNAYDLANVYFDKVTDLILNRLAQHDIYTVNSQTITNLAEECGVFGTFEEGFSAVENRYYSIEQKAEEAKLRRELRKESRGKFVGGGFGIDGAIKGAIQAGIMNQVTGMGHSLFNAIGNARTEREKQEQLMTLHVIATSVISGNFKQTISNYYVVMLAVLNKYNLVAFDWPSDEDEEQAKAILENLKSGRIPKEKMDSVLYKLVTLDPFNMRTYQYILEKKWR